MKPINTRTWSTPFVIICSFVIAFSGVMMFFHIGENLLKSMHEWLGLLFVIAIILHLLNHWIPFARYFSNKKSISIFISVIFIAAAWIGFSWNSKPHPVKQFFKVAQLAPISALANLQGESADNLVTRLKLTGLKVESSEQNLMQIATINERHPFEVVEIIVKTK